MSCGHNNCPPQWELVLSFLVANGVYKRTQMEIHHENFDDC